MTAKASREPVNIADVNVLLEDEARVITRILSDAGCVVLPFSPGHAEGMERREAHP